MRLRMMLSMLSLALLSSCTTAGPVDSFCQVYSKVIAQKGTKITAPLDVKQRLLANEKFYREQCPQGT